MVLFVAASLLALLATQASSVMGYGCGAQHNGTQDWVKAAAMADDFVAELTLTEKIGMIQGNSSAGSCIGNIPGVPRLGFRGLCMFDGPNGLNRADQVSAFTSGLSAAASWDRKIIYRRGFALGKETKGKGANMILGPSVNPMGRHALGGRNWEGFGPDPYLAGVAMDASIRGIQDAGAQTCSKHYIANEQETQRTPTTGPNGERIEAVSSNVDDRTMHELYLWPFANAVKAGTSSLMCSYNRVSNQHACENSHLLKELLRDELGFKGFVVSDWFATHSTAKAINAGLDMEMPGFVASMSENPAWFGDLVLKAIRDGTVSEARLDEMVRRIMTPYFYLGQDASDFPSLDPFIRYATAANHFGLNVAKELGLIAPGQKLLQGRNVRGNHGKLIREHGAAGTVLLKNTNKTLPVQAPKVIGVFGNDAADMTTGFAKPAEPAEDVNTGTIVVGGGSGTVYASYVVSPLEAIKAKARETGASLVYITDNNHLARNDFRGIYPIPDICFVFQQTFASEGFDRTEFELDGNSTVVINNVANFCDNTVVVTHSGGINTMPWAENPKVGAILAAHYPGQESGNAIVDLLWGDVAPSGRLPYTIPRDEADAGPPVVNLTGQDVGSHGLQADFTEGQNIDYRHYDAEGIEPLYEFGFGLTYTTFSLVDGSLTISHAGDATLAARPDPKTNVTVGGHPELWETVVVASVKVTNTGNREAHAVPQLYLSFPEDTTPEGNPVKVLRGFEKVLIAPGETAEVEFPLMRRDISYWDVEGKDWVIPAGEFVFRAGFSSRDLPVQTTFKVLEQ